VHPSNGNGPLLYPRGQSSQNQIPTFAILNFVSLRTHYCRCHPGRSEGPMRCLSARFYYVTIVTNRWKTLYIGVTSNLERRIWEHKHAIGLVECITVLLPDGLLKCKCWVGTFVLTVLVGETYERIQFCSGSARIYGLGRDGEGLRKVISSSGGDQRGAGV
jgi:hypothetical protein